MEEEWKGIIICLPCFSFVFPVFLFLSFEEVDGEYADRTMSPLQ